MAYLVYYGSNLSYIETILFYMWFCSYVAGKKTQYVMYYFVVVRAHSQSVRECNGNIQGNLMLDFVSIIITNLTRMFRDVESTKEASETPY